MPRSLWAASLAALTLTVSSSLAVVSCGGGDSPSAPSSPAPAPSPTPAPAPAPNPAPGGGTATITITATGVTPRELVVARGTRVTFVNNDGVGHDMNSDPHPQHTSCTDMNVGFVTAGTNRQTDVLNIARTCGYHDHNQPSNASLQGTIRIE
jgi:plastocyanin